MIVGTAGTILVCEAPTTAHTRSFDMNEKLIAWLEQQVIREVELMMDFERDQLEARRRYRCLDRSTHRWVQTPETVSLSNRECRYCGQRSGAVMRPCPYSEH